MAYPYAPGPTAWGNNPPWKPEYVGKGIYKVYPDPDVNSGKIDMTGAAVTSQIPIPFPHRLVKLLLRHTDNTPADNTNALSLVFRRAAGSMIPKYFEEDLVDEDNITEAKVRIKFGETHEYEPSIWSLILNTSNGHYVFPVLYVQKIGGDVQE